MLPEINMTNANAHAFLRLLSLEPIDEGVWEIGDFPGIRQRLTLILNQESVRASAVTETVDARGPRTTRVVNGIPTISAGARLVECGRSDEYIVRRANDLLELVCAAQAGGYRITWA